MNTLIELGKRWRFRDKIPRILNYLFFYRGEIVRLLVWEELEIDQMMSWLSTLGGAFSALGDYFSTSAEIAGKISFHQMKLAIRLDNPFLLSRCFLYLSISLIQKNKFKSARKIIEKQYEFAQECHDTRLRKMCLGIWSKLQYTHHMRRINKRLWFPNVHFKFMYFYGKLNLFHIRYLVLYHQIIFLI